MTVNTTLVMLIAHPNPPWVYLPKTSNTNTAKAIHPSQCAALGLSFGSGSESNIDELLTASTSPRHIVAA